MGEDLPGHVPEVLALLDQAVHELEDPPSVTDGERVGQLELQVRPGRADQHPDGLDQDRPAPEHDALVQE